MKFGLMFFASSEEALGEDKYRLVLESARFADDNGFSSVWVPERHFTEFGSLYPNPAVLQAALATCTSRIKLMAGSVVAPLHHSIRITEEWAMVDNLSGGRVGISFAPGWNPDDFTLSPEKYASRQEVLQENIRMVRHLWQGGTVEAVNGVGEMRRLRVYPTPVQPELPVWLTAAGNPQTFIRAGEMGANLLTHILDQDEEQLAHKIALYREARAANGFDPASGVVTAMLHTFVGGDAARVREQARKPFCDYLRSNIGLLNGLAKSRGQQIDVRSLPARQLDEFIQFLYERFAQTRGLIGTPESCMALVESLQSIGVDEVACLLDFGPPVGLILENLPHLNRLRQLCLNKAAVTERRGAETRFDPREVQTRCGKPISGSILQQRLRERGTAITDNFEAIEQMWRGSHEALAKIDIKPGAASALGDLRSALLDASTHVLTAAADREDLLSLSRFGTLRLRRQPTEPEAWCHAVVSGTPEPNTVQGDIRLYDRSGRLLIEIDAMGLQPLSQGVSYHDAAEPQSLDEVLYRRDWKLLEAGAEVAAVGEWLIFADRGGTGTRLAAELEASGGACSLIFDEISREHFNRERPLRGILYLRSLDLAPTDMVGRKRISADVLDIVRALAKSVAGTDDGASQPRLWLVTSRAMPVLADEMPAVAQTSLWGLGQAIAVEHPQMWGGLLDLDPSDADGDGLWAAIRGAGARGETKLAMRGQGLYGERIVRNDSAFGSGPSLRFEKNATYLVTGRLDGLGLHLAEWMRAHGAGHIALMGRSDPAHGSQHSRFFRCDLSNSDQTVATIREIERSMPPLKGVFHLAGTLDDGLLLDQTPERFYSSGTGKAEGALNLHTATEPFALDHFVLYSSVATLLTAPGQGSYAAANIVLDALAHRRRAEGKPALCVNWGPWAEIGMNATEYGRAANERLEAAGINPLDPKLALNVLEHLLQAGATQAAVARIDWARLFAGDPRLATLPLLSGFVQTSDISVYQETPLVSELRACPPADRFDRLATVITGMLAESLRLPDREAISLSQSFFELGVDSILALELTNQFSSRLGRVFPGTLLFTSLTAGALAEQLLRELVLTPQTIKDDGLKLPALGPQTRPECLPLSFAQERLWMLEQLGIPAGAYTIAAGMRLHGDLDREAFRATLAAIVERHEILRTRFGSRDGVPYQVVEQAGTVPLEFEDLSAPEPDAREQQLRRAAAEETTKKFNLEAGPLLRVRLLRLGDTDNVVLLAMHHILSDGWSMRVLLREISRLYTGFVSGRPAMLDPLRVQYADYALWQRGWLKGEPLERQKRYWREQLEGAPAVLEFPTDFPRSAQRSFHGASIPIGFSKRLSTELKLLARQEDATLFMAVLAAFQLLLGRWSGQDEVVVGTPIANRTEPAAEGLIGFFANTLALRAEVGGRKDFRTLLGEVRKRTLGAYAHQDMPFEQIVELLTPERDLSRQPVFQAALNFAILQDGELEMAGLETNQLEIETQRVSFDLVLDLTETEEGLRGRLEYATDLFERSTMRRLIESFERLLESVVGNPELELGAIDLLSPDERTQLLYGWNDTQVSVPRSTLPELFEAQVIKMPDATAVVYEDQSLTYRELNLRANQLAHLLIDQGVGPETIVGICVERSLEMVISLLGVLKAGGAYLPLDPGYPKERLAYMVEDAQPLCVITAGPSADVLGAAAILLRLDQQQTVAALAARPQTNPEHNDLRPEHPAYVIYTSGSTGRPKGVVVEHRNVVRLFDTTEDWFKFGSHDVWTMFHSYAFDFSVWELWGAFLRGGRLVVVPHWVTRSSQEFLKLLVREGVTVLNQTPSAFYQLMHVVGENAAAAQGMHLRLVIFGGEALEPRRLQRWYDKHAETSPLLVNMYGITETTVHVSYKELSRASSEAAATSVIGVKLPDLRVYVLDGRLQPVPVGVSGELYIAGAGLARGYLNRAELTAERFIASPYGDPGSRMYRTGDVARYRADGNLEYLGRADDQVKIRGFRIELSEIEVALSGHASIAQAAVVVREDEPGDKRLVAYVVASAGSSIDAVELRGYLGRSLPEYMVPAAFVEFESLPLTSNGKLDRKKLPAPEWRGKEYEAPVGETERVIAEVFAEVLKLERVGREDNFFELGGHSLLATRLVSQIRQRGLEVGVRALFMAPSVKGLALSVGGDSRSVEVPANLIPIGCEAITAEMLPLVELTEAEIGRLVEGVPGGAENVQDIYALAPMQEGILFHHVLDREGDAYLLSGLFGVESRERLELFLSALQAVIDRHDILRTAMHWEGLREPVQVVLREARLRMEEVELDTDGQDAAEQLYARFDPRHSRMDVREAPLLRACVAEDKANHRWLLLLQFHHLVSDHTTLEVIQEEIHLYLRGEGELLPKPLPFRNLVAQARLGVSREEHEAFFGKMLGDVEEPTAPFGLLEVQQDGSGIEESAYELDAVLSRRLRATSRRLGVSAASLCHVAWAQVLGRLSGREDVIFGTVLFGRMQGVAGADRMVGSLVNTLPIRIKLGETSVETDVRQTHAMLAELLRHEHASLALAQRTSGVAAGSPLFTALLNYRHSAARSQSSQTRGWEGIEMLRAEERTNYPLMLSVDDLGEGFGLTAQVVASIDPQRICAYMRTALKGLVEVLEMAPSTAVRGLEILSESERTQLLYGWNDTAVSVPRSTLPELFELQVERTPEAVAVVYQEQSLTYAELNGRANQLAYLLRERDVGPETIVGICIERSLEMVISLLGVLKAGGAYLPLDPSYPQERLSYMLEDAQPLCVITAGVAAEVLPASTPLLRLDQDKTLAALVAQLGANPKRSALLPEHSAYVIYTSGSTGRPKGVVMPHGNLANLIRWQVDRSEFRSLKRVVQFAALGFDVSFQETFSTLCSGGSLFLIHEEMRHDPAELMEFIWEKKIERLFLPYVALQSVAEAASGIGGKLEGADKQSPLKEIITAGEQLRVEGGVARFFHQLGNCSLKNQYGPTETHVGSSFELLGKSAAWPALPPIGRPIWNTQIYVLDGRLQPVPVGVAGELYIAGAGLARGYLNRTELTSERFIASPYGEPGSRMYRSGDVARYRADGNLEYLGRVDDQVKIRGFRIELGEIEAALSGHASVAQSVVVAREDQLGDKRLVAYVIASAGSHIDAAELRSYLFQRLPEYMVPAAYVELESLPLSPNGKLDRKKLPAPEWKSKEYKAPVGETERAIAEVFAEVLKLERVGREDNFFELGGHSLLATQVVSQLRQRGLEVGIRALFMTPSVKGLATEKKRIKEIEL